MGTVIALTWFKIYQKRSSRPTIPTFPASGWQVRFFIARYSVVEINSISNDSRTRMITAELAWINCTAALFVQVIHVNYGHSIPNYTKFACSLIEALFIYYYSMQNYQFKIIPLCNRLRLAGASKTDSNTNYWKLASYNSNLCVNYDNKNNCSLRYEWMVRIPSLCQLTPG